MISASSNRESQCRASAAGRSSITSDCAGCVDFLLYSHQRAVNTLDFRAGFGG